MKKLIAVLIAVILLLSMMFVAAFAAGSTTESGVYDLTINQEYLNSVTLVPQKADGSTVKGLEVPVEGTDTVLYPAAEKFAMTYSGATPGSYYLVMVIEATQSGSMPVPTEDNTTYIDQQTAVESGGSGSVTFTLFPKEIKEEKTYLICLSGDGQELTQVASFMSGTLNIPGDEGESGGSGGDGGGIVDDETNEIAVPDVENGSATVSPKDAAPGTTVTVTPKANEGFEPDGIEVTDSKGNPVEVKDNGDGTYSFIMPEGPVTVTPLFKPIEDHDKTCPSKKFTDVDITQWYHLDLDYVLNKGMMNGTSDTTFDPQGTTNRAMIVTILYRMEGEPKAKESAFTDLTQDWYKAAVGWAAENGIVKGTSATTFAPTDPITREQFATILHRYAEYKKYDVSEVADLSKYTDNSKIHDYAREAMSWANAAGLINGMTETTLQPVGNATRAQAAAILHRFCENIAK